MASSSSSQAWNNMMSCIILCIILMALPKFCYCGVKAGGATSLIAKATFYGSKDHSATPSGACGYEEYGKVVNYGQVCGVSSSKLYKNGSACGACYQVKCKNEEYCDDKGTVVVVTDSTGGDENAEFVLSFSAFLRLAKPLMGAKLIAEGNVVVEYERVPCAYPGANLMVKIHESSKFSNYLALVFLYQGGITEITSVQVWEESQKQWKSMARVSGSAVWAISNPPKGPLKIRFQVRGATGVKWVQPVRPLPADWKAGILVDTLLQIA